MDLKISPSLWFDTQAEEAAEFYTSVFETRASSTPPSTGGLARGQAGTVMTVEFELAGSGSSGSTADRGSRSTRPSRSRSAARTRPRSTASGSS